MQADLNELALEAGQCHTWVVSQLEPALGMHQLTQVQLRGLCTENVPFIWNVCLLGMRRWIGLIPVAITSLVAVLRCVLRVACACLLCDTKKHLQALLRFWGWNSSLVEVCTLHHFLRFRPGFKCLDLTGNYRIYICKRMNFPNCFLDFLDFAS